MITKKIQLCLMTILLSTQLSIAQNFVWAKQMGGTSSDIGRSIAVDASGNVYTTGDFSGTVDFDPGLGTTNLTSVVGYDIFVQKLDASGNLVWAKQIEGASLEQAYSIAIDALGNVYTTGYFSGTADFDPGSGTTNLTSTGYGDIFVQKLDASGNLVWVKRMGGTSPDYGFSIAVDASGNVYTTGDFFGTADFDPGPGTSNLTSLGGLDIFVQKLDAAGNFVWAKQMGGVSDDYGNSIAVDSSGNVYTTGGFSGIADFDHGLGTSNLTSAGSYDIFVQKLDAAGNLVWVKQMGGAMYDYGNSIVVDISGNVYTIGYFSGTADFDHGSGTSNLTSAGSYDIFVQKLDTLGNLVWVQPMGGVSDDEGYSIAVDDSTNVYTTGYFSGTADFDPGVGTTNLTSAGYGDIFVQKLDAAGNFLWVRQMGGSDYDKGNSIVVDTSGNVYTTGNFSGTVDFDPGLGTTNLTSAGNEDIFVQKLATTAVGIEEKVFGNKVLIYPNPTKGMFTLSLPKLTSKTTFSIYNVLGKEVDKQVIKNNKTLINLTSYDKGIYFIKIQNGNSVITKSIVKQ